MKAPTGAEHPRTAQILLIEEHVAFADALAGVFSDEGLPVCGHAASGEEGLAMALELGPGVVLLDLGLRDADGLALGRKILSVHPRTAVIALSTLDEPGLAERAFAAGFAAYVSKQTPLPRLVAVTRAACRGETSPVASRPARVIHIPDEADQWGLIARQLSRRERQVLELLAAGWSGPQIARQMGISAHTVRTHVQNLLGKLQVNSRLEAVTFAVRHGIVSVPRTTAATTSPVQPRTARA